MYVVAMQAWDGEGMTFVPSSNFLEFIPETESIRSAEDPDYVPRTVLLSELEADSVYEIVVTNFKGGPFVRYRPRDLARITSLRNERLGIDLPQMTFEARADEVIDLVGFTRLTEKTIEQAIENSGLEYEDWTARRDAEEQHPVLHLYVELRTGDHDSRRVGKAIHRSLVDLDPDYQNLEQILGMKPLRVTLLAPGTLQRYYLERKKAGAELAHRKPPQMIPSDEVIERLLACAS